MAYNRNERRMLKIINNIEYKLNRRLLIGMILTSVITASAVLLAINL